MTTLAQGEVTRLLDALRAGESAARDRLFTPIHKELHDIARDLMKGVRPSFSFSGFHG